MGVRIHRSREAELEPVPLLPPQAVSMDHPRGYEEAGVGEAHAAEVQVSQEVPELGAAHQAMLSYEEAEMQARDSGAALPDYGRYLGLHRQGRSEPPSPVDLVVTPVVVGVGRIVVEGTLAAKGAQLDEFHLADHADLHVT
jgi:hypothetical protein